MHDETFAKRLQQYRRAVNDHESADEADAIHDIFALTEEWADETLSIQLELTKRRNKGLLCCCRFRGCWC